jgi:hypothetical protein
MLIPASAVAQETKRAERFSLGAQTEVHWALGTGRGRSQQAELVFQPKVEMALGERSTLTAIGRFRADAFDQLEPGDPTPQEVSRLSRRALVGDRIDLELREFYVETKIADTYVTVGKQQIVWGQADGLKILDVVNPQDFREFILNDFEDSRIPLWAFNVEIPIQEFVFQLVWLPDPSYHELPERDSAYAFTVPEFAPRVPPGVRLDLRGVDRPRRILRDSDAGARVSTFWRGWDLTLNYLYYYEDIPVPYRKLSLAAGGPVLTVTPEYQRTHLMGGTFSNAFGDLTVRGEIGYSTDRYFATIDPKEPDGVVQTGELAYVLGFDWYGFSDTMLSFQLFQTLLADDEPGLIRDDLETVITLLARRESMNARLIFEVIWLQGLNHADGLVRPKVTYELSDTLIFKVGLDLFYGSKYGVFGQFDQNDRVSVSLEWSI